MLRCHHAHGRNKRLVLRQTPSGGQVVDLLALIRDTPSLMITSCSTCFDPPLPLRRPSPCSPREPCLRTSSPCTRGRRPGRSFARRIALWAARVWAGVRRPCVIVTPTPSCGGSGVASASTGPSLSARPTAAPAVHAEIKVRSCEWPRPTPPWGAPRIHGELLKLGIHVAERTVSRLLPKRRTPPSQTWRTFLANHVRDLVSLDFFHGAHRALARALRSRRARSPSPRRCPLQRDRAPHRPWTPANRGRLPERLRAAVLSPPDRDTSTATSSAPSEGNADRGSHLRRRTASADPFVDGSSARSGASVSITFSLRRTPPAPHPCPLLRVLSPARTHLSLDKDTPDGRPIEPAGLGTIIPIPEVGGLHHRYVRRAHSPTPASLHSHQRRLPLLTSGQRPASTENLVLTGQGRQP